MQLHPLAARVVRAEYAERVVSPPYDALTPEQRRELAEREPLSYLNVTRSPEDTGEEPVAVVAAARVAYRRLVDSEAFGPPVEGLFLLRLRSEHHEQVGVVGDVSIAHFLDGSIRPHEAIRPARVALLADHLDAVGATSSPVALTHRHIEGLTDLVAEVERTEPVLDHDALGDLRQTVWRVAGDRAEGLADLFAGVPTYITDGHHRMGAAAEWARRHGLAADDPRARVMVVLFPDDQLRIEAFHRYVSDLGGHHVSALLAALAPAFEVEADDGAEPAHGRFVLLVAGHRYRLTPREPVVGSALDRLDVSVLQHRLLAPVLGIDDPGTDTRLLALPGATGRHEVEHRVAERGGVGVLLAPMRVGDLLDVADAGQSMPPKSSYLTPKPRSGVFLVER